MPAPKASQDEVGLALSGGGIRSASFNLGLLQALDRLGLLSKISYISTVSGGGYTGGFYDVWRRCHPNGRLCASVEPDEVDESTRAGTADDSPDESGTSKPNHGEGGEEPTGRMELPAVRHLREHSRFLVPRGGTQHVELWEGLLAIVLGLVVTLLLATAASVLLLVGWRLLVGVAQYAKARSLDELADIIVRLGGAALVFTTLAYFEHRWHVRRFGKPSKDVANGKKSKALWMGAVAAALVFFVETVLAPPWLHILLEEPLVEKASSVGPLDLLFPPLQVVSASTEFRPVLVLGSCAALVALARVWSTRQSHDNDPLSFGGCTQRLAARLIALIAISAALGFIWWVSGMVPDWLTDGGDISLAAAITGSLAAAASVAFTTATRLFRRIKEVAIPKSLTELLRPAIPIVLANVAVAAYLISVALVLRVLATSTVTPWALCVLAVPFVLLFFDATRFGARELYRRRIYDAFLVGGTVGGDKRAGTGESPRAGLKDPDTVVANDAGDCGPRLLVCCAANDLGGDPLVGLDRGASHAVFDGDELCITTRKRGVAGTSDRVVKVDVSRSDRITASAAAVNSQMGSFSSWLGPAVAFLTCALNLRLGLWVQVSKKRGWWELPGWFFFMEMLSRTRADGDWVHLSDGGHFENLALYELIRRKCRYVVVSDCGADEAIEFADLGNAIRRVREDFGVEIEIDVHPLRPNEGLSKQHVVVGTIHYDGFEGLDKGIVLYVKPTLTGDEPPDIQHYRARNPAFPHESTGDQFFDEAQWESYRRLGEHVGRKALGLVDNLAEHQREGVERIFTDARRHWHAAPPGHEEAFSGLRERAADLEKELRSALPAYVRAEFAPEVYAAHATKPPRTQAADDATKVLVFYIAVGQLLEDAWTACQFETHGEHPLNEGWLGYMRRWAWMPSFRQWWPIIRPIFSVGFREFMKRRFGLSSETDDLPLHSRLEQRKFYPGQAGDCFAWNQLVRRKKELVSLKPGFGAVALYLRLEGAELEEIQVGVLVYRDSPDEELAEWSYEDWHVPAPLHGAGIVGKFLDLIIEGAPSLGWKRARVNLGRPVDRLGRQRAVRAMEFFRGRKFTVKHTGGDAVFEREFRDEGPASPDQSPGSKAATHSPT